MTLSINYCHQNRILHRDLKPENFLLKISSNQIKLIDFGLARSFSVQNIWYTLAVVTLFYRAPEILLGSQNYTFTIDIWSLGCILGEMIYGRAIFHGKSELETLYNIFFKLETPTS